MGKLGLGEGMERIKLHQNLDGFPCENEKRKHSKFWNEGKWDNFVKPLLPENCKDMTFIEIGCNAGLFLRMASNHGFRDVIGYEKDVAVVYEGIKYRNLNNFKYIIFNLPIDDDFIHGRIPIADVVLISNMHYYIDLNSWIKYIDWLKSKTAYCIIVSRHLRNKKHWMPGGEPEDIKRYFKEWRLADDIPGISTVGDPHPRELFSFLFKGNLNRTQISEIKCHQHTPMAKAKIKLAEEIANNDKCDFENSDYYREWEKRKPEWGREGIYNFVKDKVKKMYSVKECGLIDPILIHRDGKLADGGHRLEIIRALGYKSVLTRTV